jgi:hypothetical protein
MAGQVPNFKFCSPLKLHHGLTGKYHAICHYSYNLPLNYIRRVQGYVFIDGFIDFYRKKRLKFRLKFFDVLQVFVLYHGVGTNFKSIVGVAQFFKPVYTWMGKLRW